MIINQRICTFYTHTHTHTHTHTERILSRETFSEVKRLTVEKQPSVALYTRFKFIVTQYGKVAVLFHASGLVFAMVFFFPPSFFFFLYVSTQYSSTHRA